MAFGLAETAELAVRVSLKDDLSRGINGLTAKVGRLESGLGKVGKGLKTAARNLAIPALAVGGLIGVAVSRGLEDLSTLESAVSSVDGAIKQMGLTGQVTGQEVADWANEIERDIGAAFDDKAITQAATTLIRFGKVGKKNLRPALEIVADLATKTGDVDSAASLLAKALADPAKAAGKLARSGVVLTKAQQKQIKAMLEVNDVAGAQEVILGAVSKATDGAAEASQGKYARAMSVLADVQEDARKALAEGFLPVITKVADLLSTELAKPQTLKNIREFGEGLASGLDSLIEIARGLPWGTIGQSLQIAGAGAKAVLQAFTGLPSWVQTAVLTGWGLNKLTGGMLGDVVSSLASGLIKGVLGINAGVVNINAGIVNGAGGVAGGIPGAVTGAAGAAGGAGLLATGAAVAVPVVIAGGVKLSGDSISSFAAENNRLAQQAGLNEAEIEAVKYYRSTGPEQQLAFKRLGRIPSKADFDSGIAKLTAATKSTSRAAGAATTPEGARLSELARKGFVQRAGETKPAKADPTVVAKQQATINAVKNAQSVATRENSAQKAELGNVKTAISTLTEQQRTAAVASIATTTLQGALQAGRDVAQRISTTTAGTNTANASRTAGSTVATATNTSASRIVAAIWAARPVIQSTTVVQKYTTSQRGGSSTGSRGGGGAQSGWGPQH